MTPTIQDTEGATGSILTQYFFLRRLVVTLSLDESTHDVMKVKCKKNVMNLPMQCINISCT